MFHYGSLKNEQLIFGTQKNIQSTTPFPLYEEQIGATLNRLPFAFLCFPPNEDVERQTLRRI